jgi:hypothetical protein
MNLYKQIMQTGGSMNKFLSILSIFLVLCFLFSTFVACRNEEPEPDNTDKNGNNADNKKDDILFPMKYTSTGPIKEQVVEWPVAKLESKNLIASSPILTRSFYPDYNSFLTTLFTLKASLGTDIKNTSQLSQILYHLLHDATGLDLYYDYAKHTSIKNGEKIYGTDHTLIGGGTGYNHKVTGPVKYTVNEDNGFYEALKNAKSGDVILVKGDVVIDLADWILPGDMVDFMNEGADLSRIQLDFTVPAGVTIMGERGIGTSKGAVLKTTSYVNFMLTLEEGARVTGLVIQGCDTPENASNTPGNHSAGIRIIGNDARVDNCEISGFYKFAIAVENAQNIQIDHNYIHHVLGWDTGVAVYVNNGSVTVEETVFSQIRRVISAVGDTTQVTYQNNVDAGNIKLCYFQLNGTQNKDEEYISAAKSIAKLVCENNTMLSAAHLFVCKGIPASVHMTNNLLGYQESAYTYTFLDMIGVTPSIFKNRFVIQNNCYDITSPYIASKIGENTDQEDTRLGFHTVLDQDGLTAPKIPVSKLPDISYSQMIIPQVISANYYGDNNDVGFDTMEFVAQVYGELKTTHMGGALETYLQDCIDSMAGYANYYKYQDFITIVDDDKTYGAYPIDSNAIGGGVGYKDIYTTGDYIVYSLTDLKLAASIAKPGEVIYVPEGVMIEMSDNSAGTVDTIVLRQGIILASNRGYVHEDGTVSTGGVIRCSMVQRLGIIRLLDETRVTGLVIRGPDPASHLQLWDRCFKGKTSGRGHQPGHDYLANATPSVGLLVRGDNIVIDNCEASGFSSSAISVSTNQNNFSSRGLKVHHSYIHHNQMKALGYGVTHGLGYSEIYCNLFNYNRHSIAGGGQPESGYKAYSNIEMGESVGHYFDMHGGGDRRDGTDIAGEYVEIYNNTFLGNKPPYTMRGVPTSQYFYFNIVYNPRTAFSENSLKRDNVTIGYNIWNLQAGNTKPTYDLNNGS